MEGDGGFHFLGPEVWSYNLYKDGSEFQRHRILPKSKDQHEFDTCLSHASVKCLEAVLRLEREHLRSGLTTPKLSIQHCIDIAKTKNPDGYTRPTQEFLKSDGVTSQAHYPYEGPPNDTVRYFQRSWLYRIEEYLYFAGVNYRPSDIVFMKLLFKCLHNSGPFIGCLLVRTGHEGKFGMEKENRWTINSPVAQRCFNGKMIDRGHAVLITGYSMSVVDGVLSGYWVFQDSVGSGEGMDGMGTMDFDVVGEVVIMRASPCGRIRYTD